MSIQAVNPVPVSNNAQNIKSVNFGKSKSPEASKPDSVEIGSEKTAKKAGSWGKAIASAIFPGLGQLCDGRTKDGLIFAGGSIALIALNRLSALFGFMSKSKIGQIAGAVTSGLAGLGAIGTYIYSVVDAYKGGKH